MSRVRSVFGRGLQDVAVVMDLHQLAAVGRRAPDKTCSPRVGIRLALLRQARLRRRTIE
jgi:hypothetical protein